jgi:DNA repair protein RecO (recombination protein O)
MTNRYRTKAFVFKKENRNDSDQLFSVFTEEFGKLEITAKAIRKITSKLRGSVDIFYLSEIEFIQAKFQKTLTDAAALEKFKNIADDFRRFKITLQIAEVLNHFIKGQERDEAVFCLLNETFSKLNYPLLTANYLLIYYYFVWNFLSLQGYSPEVQKCAACLQKLNPYGIYFSLKEGGVICKKCLNPNMKASKINSDIVKILRIILNKNLETLSRLKVAPFSQNLLENISKNSLGEVVL